MTALRTIVLSAIVLFFSFCVHANKNNRLNDEQADAIGFAKKLGVGWNLGCGLDTWSRSTNFQTRETEWGNPYTTEQMILSVKNAGFNTIRVPVTWIGTVGPAPDYTIHPEWMNRVQEVVDYAYNNGLYVIVNIHHDGDWLSTNPPDPDDMYNRFDSMWRQIALRFKDYSERLIMEPMNEIRYRNNWVGSPEYFAVINNLNERFVRTVRSAGGNNATRYLLLPTYGAIVTKAAVEALVLPEDDRLMVSVHDYIPQAFTFKPKDFNSNTEVFDVENSRAYYEETFERLHRLFVSKGVPVIMGEFGAVYKRNEDELLKWAETFCSVARKYELVCIYWDDGWQSTFDGIENNTGFGNLDRRTLTWRFPALRDKIINTCLGNVTADVPDDKKTDNSIVMIGEKIENFRQKLGVGWNLGNTLDAPGSETAWGNPVTTEAMIREVKKGGFKTFRIPISWQVSNATNTGSNSRVGPAPDYTIPEEWMSRVQQVVDWVYNADMNVIINTHHDNGYWLNTNPGASSDAMYEQFEKMWTQIAIRFKDYSDRLIFEPFNEIRVHSNWSGDPSHYAVVNELIDRFVKLVRKTGGNNATRYLLCPTYAAVTIPAAVEALRLPNDPYLIVSVHDYIPQPFTFKPGDFNPNTSIFEVEKNRTYYEETFGRLYNLFISKGIPVIMGEFGAVYKQNETELLKWAETYCSVARKYGLVCIYWDDGWQSKYDGAGSNTGFGNFDRRTLTWRFPSLRDKIINTCLGK